MVENTFKCIIAVIFPLLKNHIINKLPRGVKNMSSTAILIIALAAIAIWSLQTYELMKPSKEQNNRKIVLLTSAGSLFTIILTVSLFQHISFF